MDRLIYTAMTGAAQTMGRQAAVAHNLANVTSTGYRAEEHRLRAVPVQSRNTPAPWRRAPLWSTPAPMPTSRPGRCSTPGAPSMSRCRARAGSRWPCPTAAKPIRATAAWKPRCNGVLQTRTGIPVQGDGGPITIPPDVKVIDRQGRHGLGDSRDRRPEHTSMSIGRIKLVNPPRGRTGARRRRAVPH